MFRINWPLGRRRDTRNRPVIIATKSNKQHRASPMATGDEALRPDVNGLSAFHFRKAASQAGHRRDRIDACQPSDRKQGRNRPTESARTPQFGEAAVPTLTALAENAGRGRKLTYFAPCALLQSICTVVLRYNLSVNDGGRHCVTMVKGHGDMRTCWELQQPVCTGCLAAYPGGAPVVHAHSQDCSS
ncbi:hypothetical protein BJ508DRAFT_302364 [Ascobolus immersus RN42]|uniref:Uncharacterized protein n=1 Tax=Ascobolus immersus RN42 TaxID=1160509 RepID=A0A3N4IMQ8_ASCIM|nr:hypothetical protein BJ508DRAFT_302364 [Ascobolus immersus RN42]